MDNILTRWQGRGGFVASFVFAVTLMACGPVALAQNSGQGNVQNIGSVERVTGVVNLLDVSGRSHRLAAGENLHEGDTVSTGADGEVLFRMVDNGAVALRPNSQVRFTQYRFQSADSDSCLLNLAKGSVRALTGIIGKLHPERAAVQTPTATIGIRGTDHETLVLLEDTPDGKAGTYDRVFEGGTYIESEDGGRLDVAPNQVGFAARDALAVAGRLGLLNRVPPFFRVGSFDDLFAVLANELQQRLKQKITEKLPGPLQQIVNLPGLGNLFNKK